MFSNIFWCLYGLQRPKPPISPSSALFLVITKLNQLVFRGKCVCEPNAPFELRHVRVTNMFCYRNKVCRFVISMRLGRKSLSIPNPAVPSATLARNYDMDSTSSAFATMLNVRVLENRSTTKAFPFMVDSNMISVSFFLRWPPLVYTDFYVAIMNFVLSVVT